MKSSFRSKPPGHVGTRKEGEGDLHGKRLLSRVPGRASEKSRKVSAACSEGLESPIELGKTVIPKDAFITGRARELFTQRGSLKCSVAAGQEAGREAILRSELLRRNFVYPHGFSRGIDR